MTDQLTGLATRHQLHLQLPDYALKASQAAPLSLLLLKLKDFPLWQSRLTPLAADRLLAIAANLVQEHCPAAALAARWSGATFALLLPETPLWRGEALAETLCAAAQAQELPGVFRNEGLVVDFHYGCATLPPQDLWQLAASAEAELKRCEGGAFRALAETDQPPAERAALLQLGRGFLGQSGPYLPRHSQLTTSLALAAGRRMQLSEAALADLELAAVYADIALAESAGEALNKPGPLTQGEFRKIQRHPQFAAELCRSLNLGEEVARIVLYHHERPDGQGYPEGLRGQHIPQSAQILSGASIYASLLLPRPYRPARRPFTARNELVLQAGKAVSAEVAHALLLVDNIAQSQ